MKKYRLGTILLLCSLFISVMGKSQVNETVVDNTILSLKTKNKGNDLLLEKGVRQLARLWHSELGGAQEFTDFCLTYYVGDPIGKSELFQKTSQYLEAIWGNYNQISLRLQWNLHLDTGPLTFIDKMFAGYNPQAHLTDDLYKNKIGLIIALNFPEYTLPEKEAIGSDRKIWAYARMGDIFTDRIPPVLLQAVSKAANDADIYVANYNIHMGRVLNKSGKKSFPEDKILLSHWNLRDEIKANYNKGKSGLDRQRTIYEVMKRIISQEIPSQVIDSPGYDWNPFTNTLQGEIPATPEGTERYQRILDNFKANKALDAYTGKTFIERKFSGEMEISVEDAKKLFQQFLSAPELREVGKMIAKRNGRKLEAFDIWYDGFKARSNMDESKLDEITRRKYPDAEALEKELPGILTKLGFTPARAREICSHIKVDPARGSGHAWGAGMKGDYARLRTRIPADGLDYKGYNIAIHELGHNVEQTISLYDVDYYMLNGVPNTAFTEALAFVFQKRDLSLLDMEPEDPKADAMNILDKFWSLYEIMGVSLLDIYTWEWMYRNPEATAEELKMAVITLSREIWNEYYAPVFGRKDETVLAIYSHMISYPLYLSAYAFGQIIEFQLEDYFNDKSFAGEVDRIYRLGRLTPNEWMIQATGNELSVAPLVESVKNVLKKNVR